MVLCVGNQVRVALGVMQVLILLVLIMLSISYWKRRWFLSEPGYKNPYRTVYEVFIFSKSHKDPLRHSAFTHCDNYIPSRLDFAKERFGGPFTTQQVENVKTFFRILLVLFAIGPVFALEVPASYFIAPLFGLHFHHYPVHRQEHCSSSRAIVPYLVEIACLYVVPSMLLFPVCLVAIFSLLKKYTLKLFSRLGIGILLCLLGVVYLLVTNITGYIINVSNSNNHTQCVFQVTISPTGNFLSICTGEFWSHQVFFLELVPYWSLQQAWSSSQLRALSP